MKAERTTKIILAGIAATFTVVFCAVVIPPLWVNPDIIGAISKGFVNPYAAGYSIDVILCWVSLAVWVIYEARALSVRNGWICLVLGVVPGVVVGLSLYLIVRSNQVNQTKRAR